MTGPNGSAGSRYLQGAELAIGEWNTRGGVLSRKIEILKRDDEGKSEKAVTVAQALVHEGVSAVLGPWNSGCGLSGSPIFHQSGIVQIVLASNEKITAQGFPRLFRIGIRDDKQALAADSLLQRLKTDRIAIIHDKTAYGQGIAEKMKGLIEARGATIVLYDGVNTEELDFRSNIAAIKSANAQAVFWGGIYNQAGPLFNQMREQGLEAPLLIPAGSMDPMLIETVGANPQGLYAAFGPQPKDAKRAEAFYENFRQTFGPEGSFSIYGYDAANVLLEAIRRAGTDDSARITEVLRTQSFEGLLGKISFAADGDTKGVDFGLWTIRDGQFVPLKE